MKPSLCGSINRQDAHPWISSPCGYYTQRAATLWVREEAVLTSKLNPSGGNIGPLSLRVHSHFRPAVKIGRFPILPSATAKRLGARSHLFGIIVLQRELSGPWCVTDGGRGLLCGTAAGPPWLARGAMAHWAADLAFSLVGPLLVHNRLSDGMIAVDRGGIGQLAC